MRINRFIAQATGMSRRSADKAVQESRVTINGQLAQNGHDAKSDDLVTLDGEPVAITAGSLTIMLNKPYGYVSSRDGQGSQTIYDLLPEELHHLKSVGRLDKESSGLLLLTNDGDLANKLTHPSFQKTKVYKIALNKPLLPEQQEQINDRGVLLDDGLSHLQLERISPTDNSNWKVSMHEGRNRQIRRTFEALGYTVVKLHRTQFGPYTLDQLGSGQFRATRSDAS